MYTRSSVLCTLCSIIHCALPEGIILTGKYAVVLVVSAVVQNSNSGN